VSNRLSCRNKCVRAVRRSMSGGSVVRRLFRRISDRRLLSSNTSGGTVVSEHASRSSTSALVCRARFIVSTTSASWLMVCYLGDACARFSLSCGTQKLAFRALFPNAREPQWRVNPRRNAAAQRGEACPCWKREGWSAAPPDNAIAALFPPDPLALVQVERNCTRWIRRPKVNDASVRIEACVLNDCNLCKTPGPISSWPPRLS